MNQNQMEKTISAVTPLEVPAKIRGTFPRFRVCIDGDAFQPKTVSALRKFLNGVYADSVQIFRNAGKGVTLDFDTETEIPGATRINLRALRDGAAGQGKTHSVTLPEQSPEQSEKRTLMIDLATLTFLAEMVRRDHGSVENIRDGYATVILKLAPLGDHFLEIDSARTPTQSEMEAERYVTTAALKAWRAPKAGKPAPEAWSNALGRDA